MKQQYVSLLEGIPSIFSHPPNKTAKTLKILYVSRTQRSPDAFRGSLNLTAGYNTWQEKGPNGGYPLDSHNFCSGGFSTVSSSSLFWGGGCCGKVSMFVHFVVFILKKGT